jgi:dTDP-4-amino-4,6-dideoxygalactose transaminase
MKFLKSKKIGTQIHYKPLFMHQKYKKIIKINLYKNSLNFYKSQISLPLHTQLNKSDIGVITRNLKSFFN